MSSTLLWFCFTLSCFSLVFSQQFHFVTLFANNGDPSDHVGNPHVPGSTYPGSRYGGCIALDPANTTIYVFGGHEQSGQTTGVLALPDLWAWNLSSSAWSVAYNNITASQSNVSAAPGGRALLSCWVDRFSKFWIYGGDLSENDFSASYKSDQWYFQPSTASWTQVTLSNSPGTLAQMATWRIGSVTWIYGGLSGYTGAPIYSCKIFSFTDGTIGTWKAVVNNCAPGNAAYTATSAGVTPHPGGRNRMAYASFNEIGYIYGGTAPAGVKGDLWAYSTTLNKWTYITGKTGKNDGSITDGNPPCMNAAVMAVTTTGNIILYGGIIALTTTQQPSTYLWKYSLTTSTWTLFSQSVYNNIVPVASFIMYTPDLTGGFYMFGGEKNDSIAGTTTNSLYRFELLECSAGTFLNSSGGCSGCPSNTYQIANSEVCVKCPNSTFSVGSAVNCSVCGLGKTSVNCSTKCPAGTYGQDAICIPCPFGTYQNTTGNGDCIACPPGYFKNALGATSCSICPDGYFSDGNATACYACPLGSYYSKSGNNFSPYGCQPCAPGFFGNTTGLTSCLTCNAGTYTSTWNSPVCQLCPNGSYSSDNAFACTPCPPGFHALHEGTAICDRCDLNRTARNSGAIFCDYCEYGSIPNANGTDCIPCPLGTFHDAFNAIPYTVPFCTPCPTGTYADREGLLECLSCNYGYYANSTGEFNCQQCPMGTHASLKGSSACSACITNTYSQGGTQWCSPTGY